MTPASLAGHTAKPARPSRCRSKLPQWLGVRRGPLAAQRAPRGGELPSTDQRRSYASCQRPPPSNRHSCEAREPSGARATARAAVHQPQIDALVCDHAHDLAPRRLPSRSASPRRTASLPISVWHSSVLCRPPGGGPRRPLRPEGADSLDLLLHCYHVCCQARARASGDPCFMLGSQRPVKAFRRRSRRSEPRSPLAPDGGV